MMQVPPPPPRHTEDYTRGIFLPRVGGGTGGHTAPPPLQYFEKIMQYSPSETIGILSKTVHVGVH